jgi:hypothetical protein
MGKTFKTRDHDDETEHEIVSKRWRNNQRNFSRKVKNTERDKYLRPDSQRNEDDTDHNE